MPTYTFKNKNTGEVIEHIMKMSEYDDYVSKNPDYERVFLDTPNVSDPWALGRLKPPHDFQKYIVGGVQQRNPYSSKSKRFDIPKEY